MAFGVTSTGFVAKTQEQILQELAEEEKANISANINTSPTEPIGQLNAIFSRKIREVWELGQAIATASTLTGASGYFLDALVKITGTTRGGATKSQVALDLTLNAGVTVAAGKIVAVSGDATKRFVTLTSVTNSGGSPAVFSVQAEAQDAGPVSANAGTITVIVDTVVGWTAVTNPEDAAQGQLSQSDFDLRVSQQNELGGLGCGPSGAIRSALLALDGMLAVTILDNDTDGVVDSVPAHTIEAVIYDGTVPSIADDTIAQTIWNTKKAGVATFGSESGTATDGEGNTHTVSFSRATVLDVWLEIDISTNANTFPDDGLDLVRDAVVSYGDANLSVGTDVILSRLCTPIFSVTGVEDMVEVRVGLAASPTQTTNFVTTSRQIADLDTSRVLVAVV